MLYEQMPHNDVLEERKTKTKVTLSLQAAPLDSNREAFLFLLLPSYFKSFHVSDIRLMII